MSSQPNTKRTSQPSGFADADYRRWLLPAVLSALAVGFLAWPGTLEGKSLAFLHGLCAQQPTHTFYFGDQRLPFDARMTGIYGGFLITCIVLLLRGCWRFAGIPGKWVIAVLAGMVALMAIDGINSTLLDMNLWHLYAPHNTFRLATGAGLGVALATFIWLMTAQIGFHRSGRSAKPAVANLKDLSIIVAAVGIYLAIVLTGWAPLRIPLTFLLMFAAIVAISGLVLAFILLLSRRESKALANVELAWPATAALLVAIVVISGLSIGRFVLEWWLDIEPAVRGTL